ncbi:hypothetical protein [Desulfosporosinus sp.]|uniref:hypothetical protein n=1 Tax=Desulfosporosinus sp. TaxID=157907 RepID=UPI002629B391|nr:hypothetical protein [Desulfosporosinus sp.]
MLIVPAVKAAFYKTSMAALFITFVIGPDQRSKEVLLQEITAFLQQYLFTI